MVKLLNLESNNNIDVTDEKGNFKVLEYKIDLSSTTAQEATNSYFMSKANVHKKQVLVTLNNDSVIMSAGAMQYVAGNVNVESNVKGVGDLLGKAFTGKVTGESGIKPKYTGTGYVMLEPTYKYLILEELTANNGLVVSDGMFLACSDAIALKTVARSSVSSAVLGKEGLFNLMLKGNGVVVLESPVPKSELVMVELNNDVLKVDGPFAIAWSDTLAFTVEKSTKSLIGSAMSGEGLVNVYRGTGTVWLACINK